MYFSLFYNKKKKLFFARGSSNTTNPKLHSGSRVGTSIKNYCGDSRGSNSWNKKNKIIKFFINKRGVKSTYVSVRPYTILNSPKLNFIVVLYFKRNFIFYQSTDMPIDSIINHKLFKAWSFFFSYQFFYVEILFCCNLK